jgi:hypothetical protein
MGTLEEIAAEVFKEAAEKIVKTLERINDLSDLDNHIVAYWVLGTHTLAVFDIYPALLLKGPPGTGKSEVMLAIEATCCAPYAFSLRNLTYPMVRDKLGECHEATAIIEEADLMQDDARIEGLLADRYARQTAKAGHKVPAGTRGWRSNNISCFGATVMHRRNPSVDAAFDGRSVAIPFRKNHKRQFEDFSACLEEAQYVRNSIEGVYGLEFQLPKVTIPTGILGRIFRTYKPLVTIAELCGGDDFCRAIMERLERDTAQLEEDQSTEPAGLAIAALIEEISTPEGCFKFRSVRIREIANKIENEHGRTFTSHQVAKLLRELGLAIKKSNGFTVVTPNRDMLLKACEEAGYEGDEAIARLQVQKAAPGSESTCSSIEKESTCSTPSTSVVSEASRGSRESRPFPSAYASRALTVRGSTSNSSRTGRSFVSCIESQGPQSEPLSKEQLFGIWADRAGSQAKTPLLPLPQSRGRRLSSKPSDQERSLPSRSSQKPKRARGQPRG